MFYWVFILLLLKEPCENGATRIISYYGTDSSTRGRVAVCHESTFKPVCDKDWNNVTAGLYCKSLGLSQYGEVYNNYRITIIITE